MSWERGRFVVREHPDHGVGAGAGRADGHKQAGRLKAQGLASIVGGGHARNLLIQAAGIGDRQRSQMAVDERHRGGAAVRKLDRQPQPEARPGQAQLVIADLVEQTRPVAENHRHAGDRVPDDVAKAAQAGEIDADPVPVRVQRHIVRGSNDQQPLGGRSDRAGVGDVQLQAGSRCKRLGKQHSRLMQLARMVGVGIECGHGKGDVFDVDANPLPVERGGDLKRDVRQRRIAVVAHR